MASSVLKSHSEVLYSLLLKPVLNSTTAFKKLANDLRGLASCMKSYAEYLETQNQEQMKRHKLDHPVRNVSEGISVVHSEISVNLDPKYALIDAAVKDTIEITPVLLDEEKHLVQPFKDASQRLRFVENIHLSVPVDIIKYCPGGAYMAIVFIVKVKPRRTRDQELTETSQVILHLKPKLPEFHTRTMKRRFKRLAPLLGGVTLVS